MKTYSDDLRKKIMEAVDRGEKPCLISKRFEVSEKTIYLWRKQRRERGHIRPITKYQKGHSHKIKDLEVFMDFATKNASLTAQEMANVWGNISASTIKNALQKIAFTRKKRLMGTKIVANKNASYTRFSLI